MLTPETVGPWYLYSSEGISSTLSRVYKVEKYVLKILFMESRDTD